MKVAIATSYYVNNYGTVLQAFAIQEYLRQHNIEADMIDVSGFWNFVRRKRFVYFVKASLTSSYAIQKSGILLNKLIKKIPTNYSRNAKGRDSLFNKFRKDYIEFSQRYKSIEELKGGIEKEYAAVIVGSDQLWLPSNIAGDYYTLSFVPDDIKKISYSTSFGLEHLTKEYKTKTSVFLSRFNHISVREKSGQRIVKESINQDVPIVLDPVMLLDKNYWNNVAGIRPIIRDDYIFCYFLGKGSKKRDYAKKLQTQTGFRIVNLPNLDEFYHLDDKYADYSLYDITPFDFINLIINAKFVLTDSFHCTAFSIMFKKDFFVFRRYKTNSRLSTNGRLDSLLEILSIEKRLIDEIEDINDLQDIPVDYDRVESYLNQHRKNSEKFLLSAIGIS